MTYIWEFVLLREAPGPDGRVPTSAFIGTYQLTSGGPDQIAGYLRSLPGLAEAIWIGITRLEVK